MTGEIILYRVYRNFSERESNCIFFPGECLLNYIVIIERKRWQFYFSLMSVEKNNWEI